MLLTNDSTKNKTETCRDVQEISPSTFKKEKEKKEDKMLMIHLLVLVVEGAEKAFCVAIGHN